ncbi:uncharacterized protein LOC131614121 [Vicia villosa]|uniref:uncharacterized protein LOC131614121 n=1 Tax=Vicia villosa TaxID=3911 RepID=UPI00273B4675|nr:uncharacterized protein LOC131614121 [Vicia villosa]
MDSGLLADKVETVKSEFLFPDPVVGEKQRATTDFSLPPTKPPDPIFDINNSIIPPQFPFELVSVEIDDNPFEPWEILESLKDASLLQNFSAINANVKGKLPEFFSDEVFPVLTLLHLAFNKLEGRFKQHPITWRRDEKYFATISVCSSNLLQKLKVWDRDSRALLASSKNKTFAGAVLKGMPSGAKIATIYDRKAENECPSIVFFERNGLERRKFSVGERVNAKLKFLKWNCSSDLLAGVVECENYDAVKIWYFSNNHWYVKHEIRYLKRDEVKFIWNQEKPLQLICWTLGGQVTVHNFVWITTVTDNSVELVTGGPNIHVTPLSLFLIVYCNNSKNNIAAFLSEGSLCVVELPSIKTCEELEGKESNVEASHTEMVFGSCPWMDVALVESVGQSKLVLFGLDEIGRSHTSRGIVVFAEKGHFEVSKDIFTQGNSVVAVLLDKFFDMEYTDCVKAFVAYASSAKKIEELVTFYNWCTDVVLRFPNAKELAVIRSSHASVLLLDTHYGSNISGWILFVMVVPFKQWDPE